MVDSSISLKMINIGKTKLLNFFYNMVLLENNPWSLGVTKPFMGVKKGVAKMSWC